MSGIRSGTRLDQLEHLQRAARLQRAYARWRGDHLAHDRLDQLVARITLEIVREQRARPTVAAAVRRTDLTVAEQLTALGVTAYRVKVWAVTEGLLPSVVRGRVPLDVMTAYTTHHQQETP